MKKAYSAILIFVFLASFNFVKAESPPLDSDKDGLSDIEEMLTFRTDPNNSDTDGDGWADGVEVAGGYDPNVPGEGKLDKLIKINLADQSLAYFLGPYLIKTFKISSGLKSTPTPKGEYKVLQKKPLVDYIGVDYKFLNTKWNLEFKKGSWGNFYIHGAYWHNKFGTPMSHGCVNVSYKNMESLYIWADVGTEIIIE